MEEVKEIVEIEEMEEIKEMDEVEEMEEVEETDKIEETEETGIAVEIHTVHSIIGGETRNKKGVH